MPRYARTTDVATAVADAEKVIREADAVFHLWICAPESFESEDDAQVAFTSADASGPIAKAVVQLGESQAETKDELNDAEYSFCLLLPPRTWRFAAKLARGNFAAQCFR